jgi:hypothetical protein
MFSIKFAIFLCIVATWLALLEVQIEGKNSWASALPCWRANPKSLVAKVYSKIMGGLPLTGYHAVMFSFVLIILHLHFFAGVQWKISEEMKVFSAYFLLCPTWDFLYFVYNPFFFLIKQDPNAIANHKTWILGIFPADYTAAILVSLFFVVMAAILTREIFQIIQWLKTVGTLGLFVFLNAVFQIWRGRA